MNQLVMHPVIAPRFGDTVESLSQDNYWAPSAIVWNGDYETGWTGERIERERGRVMVDGKEVEAIEIDSEARDMAKVNAEMAAIYNV